MHTVETFCPFKRLYRFSFTLPGNQTVSRLPWGPVKWSHLLLCQELNRNIKIKVIHNFCHSRLCRSTEPGVVI